MSGRPDSLETKFKLMTLLPFDKRAGHKLILVYGFILDWHHSKYGDALVSVRHIVAHLKERDPFGAGISVSHVHSALPDLVSWGYLTVTPGSGKRAARYVPVWAHGSSVYPASEVYESTKAAFLDALAAQPKAARMMRIDPFDAEDEDGETIRVIGVYDDDEEMRFIVINEEASGEIYPVACRTVFKKGSSSAVATTQ